MQLSFTRQTAEGFAKPQNMSLFWYFFVFVCFLVGFFFCLEKVACHKMLFILIYNWFTIVIFNKTS